MFVTANRLHDMPGFFLLPSMVEITNKNSSCGIIIEPRHDISNNVVCATNKASDQPAHMRSLIRVFAGRLNILQMFSYRLNIIWSF